MNNIYILGNSFNGLEFFVYVLIPTSIVLMILVYIFFNIRLMKITYDFDFDDLFNDEENQIEDENNSKMIESSLDKDNLEKKS